MILAIICLLIGVVVGYPVGYKSGHIDTVVNIMETMREVKE